MPSKKKSKRGLTLGSGFAEKARKLLQGRGAQLAAQEADALGRKRKNQTTDSAN